MATRKRKKTGITLTRLELEIMRVVWDDEPVTAREVLERLNEGRRPALAYNTIQTMLTVLRDKGVVRSRPGSGRAHVFEARVSQDAVSVTMVEDLVERLYDGRVQPLMLQLVDSGAMDDAALADLRRLIDSKLKKRGSR